MEQPKFTPEQIEFLKTLQVESLKENVEKSNKSYINITEKIQEHKKNVDRRTYTTKEMAEVLGISEAKARQLTHAKGFPVICIGRSRRVIISKLDEWLENNIGEIL